MSSKAKIRQALNEDAATSERFVRDMRANNEMEIPPDRSTRLDDLVDCTARPHGNMPEMAVFYEA